MADSSWTVTRPSSTVTALWNGLANMSVEKISGKREEGSGKRDGGRVKPTEDYQLGAEGGAAGSCERESHTSTTAAFLFFPFPLPLSPFPLPPSRFPLPASLRQSSGNHPLAVTPTPFSQRPRRAGPVALTRISSPPRSPADRIHRSR